MLVLHILIQKNTYINACISLYISKIAIVHICTVTVAVYINNLLFFLSHLLGSLSLSQRSWQPNKEEEDDKHPTTNSAPPNCHHRNPLQQLIIHHKIDPKSTSNQAKQMQVVGVKQTKKFSRIDTVALSLSCKLSRKGSQWQPKLDKSKKSVPVLPVSLETQGK